MRQTRKKGAEKFQNRLEITFLSDRDLDREIGGWRFLDLGHFVENEGQKHLPHFQETDRSFC
jgi:hypothetical protein